MSMMSTFSCARSISPHAGLPDMWGSQATKKQIELLDNSNTRTVHHRDWSPMFRKVILSQSRRDWRKNGHKHLSQIKNSPLSWSTSYNQNRHTKVILCCLRTDHCRLTHGHSMNKLTAPHESNSMCHSHCITLYAHCPKFASYRIRYLNAGSTLKSILHDNSINISVIIDFLNAFGLLSQI